jgi:transcriptional regulator with XRE-family HTH domain
MDKNTLRLKVGSRIRACRESEGLTLHMLADMVGTSYTHIWKIENGKVSVGLDLLGRISEALDVPLRELVDPAPRRKSSFDVDITIERVRNDKQR